MKKIAKIILLVSCLIFSICLPAWVFEPLRPWGKFEVVVRLLSITCAGFVWAFYADFIEGGNQ